MRMNIMKKLILLFTIVLFCTIGLKAQSVYDWMELAKSGDSEGCYQVGLCYLNGDDEVSRDKDQAIEWFKKAAKKEHVEAMFQLGKCYQWSGVIEGESLKWYKQAADKGHAEASAIYGWETINQSKKRSKKDWKTAYNYLMFAAENGYSYAYVYLSRLYTDCCRFGECSEFYSRKTAKQLLEIGWQKYHDPEIQKELYILNNY